MSQFISLHLKENNKIIGVDINNIICATVTGDDTKTGIVYFKSEEHNPTEINERPYAIRNKIGDTQKTILLHTASGNDILIMSYMVTMVEDTDLGTFIHLDDDEFAPIHVAESVTKVIDALNV